MVQLAVSACASRSRVAPDANTGVRPVQPTQDDQAPQADATLNADESLVRSKMARHVEKLSFEIGERHDGKPWELADAADYVATELEGMGYAIERQGYEVGSTLAQNLAVTVPGGTRGDERIIIGAHYDGPLQSRGVTSAVSTAALLELARLMRGARMERTLILAFFALGASPQLRIEDRGARHFARKLQQVKPPLPDPLPDPLPGETPEPGPDILAALLLENLLNQAPAESLPVRIPVVSSPGAVKFEAVLAGTVNDELMVLSPQPWSGLESDSLAFHESGIPTVCIGGPMTEEEPGSAGAVPLDSAARALVRLRYALGDWLVERPTNDAMVTPTAAQLE